MNAGSTYLGETEFLSLNETIQGEFVVVDGETYYKIEHYNLMDDFFMSIVSDSDHWMFLSSNGSLSAGRKNRDNALFPYYTDDKIHDYKGLTGSLTALRVTKAQKTYLWEPFTDISERVYTIERNLYKNVYGNRIIFEERNLDLGLIYSYAWNNSEQFGFVRTSKLSSISEDVKSIAILDGIQNILPSGIDFDFQNAYSNLLDGYKKNEQLPESGMGLFMLSSIPVDRAEPSESLRTTTVWSQTINANCHILLSTKQYKAFCKGADVHAEMDVRATRGAYLLHQEFDLSQTEATQWYIVSEINQDVADVKNLDLFIRHTADIPALLNADIALGSQNLKKIVASADGLQMSNEPLGSARHFSNTMFNVMRGGIFTNNYTIDTANFVLYIKQVNTKQAQKHAAFLQSLPEKIHYNDLFEKIEAFKDVNLIRICMEYLPLTFSRRHGDPSRPWNIFSIETKNEDGSPKLNYQGNWRDIFQNWEALCLSYPEFVEGIIAKFVNATTADGYNPYRISREGIDWECPDPEDPWAYIGYWGDHQIIYLQKLLELSKAHHPEKFETLLSQDLFAYANVPYRIKSYADIVDNPKDTIAFDAELNHKIKALSKDLGADGRLMLDGKGEVVLTNLVEKVMVTLLAKLSNFIPEAGIWLNTQRPEWNDANNALVGSGVSMVTLYYMRRFVNFWADTLAQSTLAHIDLSEELTTLFSITNELFVNHTSLIETGFSDADRQLFTDVLGQAGEKYRNAIYSKGFSGEKVCLSTQELAGFMRMTLDFIDQSIRANKRADGLYHAYNLMSSSNKGIRVRYLYEMLEGQVSVLSAGYLSVDESLNVLDALKASALFREDQYSYILYPDRQLARFADKNNLTAEQVQHSTLIQKLIANGDTNVVEVDDNKEVHFSGGIRNADFLKSAIKKCAVEVSNADLQEVLDIYEVIFDHQSFTGRSGTFYAYEGLGSIYWHMVSKLLLSTQEVYKQAIDKGASAEVIGRLRQHYYEIKAGIGLYKSPALYGAFPTDAYSHTPGGAGAKQPGMTGQVKEDVISRFGELGVKVNAGKIGFNLELMNPDELILAPAVFTYFDVNGAEKSFDVMEKQLAFTYCQVPVVYKNGKQNEIKISLVEGESIVITGCEINASISAKIFARTAEVEKIEFIYC